MLNRPASRKAILTAALLATASFVHAQSYPVKPIRMIIGFTPGTATDIFARIVGQKLAVNLGQPVVIENTAGAGGTIAATSAARSTPDGYTLWLGADGQLIINPLLYKSLQYDPIRDFAPIVLLSWSPSVLVVHPALPVASVRHLVGFAKARPGQINYASAGKGTASHLNAELFKSLTGVNMVEIPYKSSAQAMTDLMAGHVSIFFPTLPPIMPHIKAGKLRALAVTSATRSRAMPDLQTMAEAGIATYEASSTLAIAAPRGTPQAVINRLNNEINRILKTPDVAETILSLGAEPLGGSPDELTKFIREGLARWGKIIASLGIQVE